MMKANATSMTWTAYRKDGSVIETLTLPVR
jgi:hypothetical protein